MMVRLQTLIVVLLHVGVAVAVPAPHRHFLAAEFDTLTWIESDTCCPSDQHPALDSIDHCSLCQRILQSIGVVSLYLLVPKAYEIVCAGMLAPPLRLSDLLSAGNKRGPPILPA